MISVLERVAFHPSSNMGKRTCNTISFFIFPKVSKHNSFTAYLAIPVYTLSEGNHSHALFQSILKLLLEPVVMVWWKDGTKKDTWKWCSEVGEEGREIGGRFDGNTMICQGCNCTTLKGPFDLFVISACWKYHWFIVKNIINSTRIKSCLQFYCFMFMINNGYEKWNKNDFYFN